MKPFLINIIVGLICAPTFCVAALAGVRDHQDPHALLMAFFCGVSLSLVAVNIHLLKD